MESTTTDREESAGEPTPKQNEMSILMELLVTLKVVSMAFLTAVYRLFVPMNRKSVTGEIVLVTGAGSGIGRQLACEFARLGAEVVLWDIDKEANDETAELIRELNGKCHTYVCDVSQKSVVYAVGRQVQDEVGDVTMLVNNAGIVSGYPILDCPDHLVEQTFKVNLLAQFWTVKFFLPSMMARNHGHIINMASSLGLVGINKLTDYCASKFGVVGFTEVLNYEIVFAGKDGVFTSVVCPSYTKTGMFRGCSMRFPSIIPPLETRETVQQIMHGILTNKHQICIPRLVYFFAVLKSILPVDAMTEVIRFFGADVFMDSFEGNHMKEEISQ